MKGKKIIIISIAVIVVVIALGFTYYYFQSLDIEKVTVRGNSLAPYLVSGDKVVVDYGYTGNNRQIKRESLIIYDFKAQNTHLIKFIKVVPGDTFMVDEENRVLLINGQPMTNTEGKIYRLTRQNVKMLKLYEDYFNGVLKGSVYLAFGNRPGTLDSGRFGPVVRKNILGKVLFKL